MDLLEVARLEETRQARGLAESASEHRPFAGGVAARGRPGSFMNTAAGMALDGPVDDAEIDSVIEWYTSAGSEPRFEVSPFVDPAFLVQLERRGFALRHFENVFFRELDASRPVEPLHPVSRDVSVRLVDPKDAAQVKEAVGVAMSGFYPEGQTPDPEDVAVATTFFVHPRTVGVIAYVDGRAVGAGSMSIRDEVCSLFGVSVWPEARRRGIQQALIAARLNEGARRGARLATIGSRPGAATERNVRRMGFQLAYTKPVLCKAGPGLVAAMG